MSRQPLRCGLHLLPEVGINRRVILDEPVEEDDQDRDGGEDQGIGKGHCSHTKEIVDCSRLSKHARPLILRFEGKFTSHHCAGR